MSTLFIPPLPNLPPETAPDSGRDLNREHAAAVLGVLGSRGDNSVGIAGAIWNGDYRLFSLGSTNSNGVSIEGFADFYIPQMVAARAQILSLSTDFAVPVSWNPEFPVPASPLYRIVATFALRRLLDSLPQLLVLKSAGNDSTVGAASNVSANRMTALQWALIALKAQGYGDRILLVGATNRAGNRAGFSNELSGTLDLYAPGDSVISVNRAGNPVYVSGTSFSAPMAAGFGAQLLTMDPSLTGAEVKGLLLAGARDSVENANGDNLAPSPVGNTTDVVYEADAYGSLRLLSSRAGKPLCGASVTSQRATVYPRYQFNRSFKVRVHRYQSSAGADEYDSLDVSSHPFLWPGNFDAFDVLDVAPGGRAVTMTSAVVAGSTNMQTNIIRLTAGHWLTTSSTSGAGGMLFGERDTLLLDANSATFATSAGRGAPIAWPDAEVYPGRVSFAPDGSRFAYTVSRNGVIELVVVNRSAPTQRLSLTNAAMADAGRTSWSPDSRTIIATSIRYPGGDQTSYYNAGIETSVYRVAAGISLAVQNQKVLRGFGTFSFVEGIAPTDEGGRFRFRLVGENARGAESPGYGDPLYLLDCTLLSMRSNSLDGELSILELSPPACPAARGTSGGGGGTPLKIAPGPFRSRPAL